MEKNFLGVFVGGGRVLLKALFKRLLTVITARTRRGGEVGCGERQNPFCFQIKMSHKFLDCNKISPESGR